MVYLAASSWERRECQLGDMLNKQAMPLYCWTRIQTDRQRPKQTGRIVVSSAVYNPYDVAAVPTQELGPVRRVGVILVRNSGSIRILVLNDFANVFQ